MSAVNLLGSEITSDVTDTDYDGILSEILLVGIVVAIYVYGVATDQGGRTI